MADRRYETLVLIHPEQGEPGSKELGARIRTLIEEQGGTVSQVQEWGAARPRVPRREAAAGVLRAVRVSRHAEGVAGDRAQPEADGPGPAVRLGPSGRERAARRAARRPGVRSGTKPRSRKRADEDVDRHGQRGDEPDMATRTHGRPAASAPARDGTAEGLPLLRRQDHADRLQGLAHARDASCPSAARSSRHASPGPAPGTSGASPSPSSRRARSRCCRTPRVYP